MRTKTSASAEQARYIDLKTDFGFRKIFGTTLNKEFLIDLLRCLIPERTIMDLTYLETGQLGLSAQSRDAVFDVRCISDDGSEFVVEMQRRNQTAFMERTLFYSTFLVQEQLTKGDRRFRLNPIYIVGILDFKLPHECPDTLQINSGVMDFSLEVHKEDENDYLVSRYALCNLRHPSELMTDNLHFVFLELGRFSRGICELQTELDRWCYALKSLQDLQKRPLEFQRDIYRRLFEVAEVAKLPKEERTKYELQMETKDDIIRQIDFAMKEGIAEGMAEGIAKGRAEGIAEGRADSIRYFAENLRAMGLTEEQIAIATRLPEA